MDLSLYPDRPLPSGDAPAFDPLDPRCKAPFGAVKTGTSVRFTLRAPVAWGLTGAFLCLSFEFADEERSLPLSPAGEEDGRRLFSVTCTVPETPELVWYHFRLRRNGLPDALYDERGFCAERGLCPWQLTVYEDKRPVPDWYGAGVSYQVFPDRFRRSRLPSAEGLPGKRLLHRDWDEAPLSAPREEEPRWCYDFFGGDLAGITEKLDYLASLSVQTLYLCPIFEASSNHRYNTGDFERIDPMLGDEDDFRTLCREAKRRGIHVMLDGVFNHVGHDSRYFNALGVYPDTGAAQSEDSPYRPWFSFSNGGYDCWWGIPSLPAVRELTPSYCDYIADGEDSIVRRWLRLGADAWRLDVADELPDAFIEKLRRAVESEKPDALLLGEVWEDGTNKISYGRRRRYLLGDELHALMNYPFRVAAMRYLSGGDARDFYLETERLREHYPRGAFFRSMNFLSTHDTPRALTALGESRERLRLGAALLYCFPGSPMLYYGDEAGLSGGEDPQNRGTYPWGREDEALLAWYRRLGRLRAECKALQCGDIRYLAAEGGTLAFARVCEDSAALCAFHAGDAPATLSLPFHKPLATDALSHQQFAVRDDRVTLTLPPLGCAILL